jgi:rhodanese-related sulfurtransferase
MKSAVICVSLLLVWAGAPAAQEHPAVQASARETSAQDLKQGLAKKEKILVIDVRSPQEFAAGHVPGAVNIPVDELARRIEEMKVPKDTTLVTMCEHGGRSSRAALELEKLGYKTSSYCTLDSWKKGGYKIEAGEAKPEPRP